MVRAWNPLPVITMLDAPELGGSLLVPVTVNEANPASGSATPTVATVTSLWLGGQSEQPGVGIREMSGAVLSILMVIGTERDSPAAFVTEHATVTPAVSAVKVVPVQPTEDVMPDSRSLMSQLTFTSLVYQPLLPNVPVTCGTTFGGVVSPFAWVATTSTSQVASTSVPVTSIENRSEAEAGGGRYRDVNVCDTKAVNCTRANEISTEKHVHASAGT